MGCKPNKESNFQVNLNRIQVNSKNDFKINARQFVSRKFGQVRDFYTLGSVIGQGAFGQVRVAINKQFGVQRAIKTVRKSQMKKADQQKFIAEVEILRQLDHPNIVRLYEFFEDSKYYHLVMEYVQGGELFDYIVQSKRLSEGITANFMVQILRALSFCHRKGIVHRDIKPENLLLDKSADDAIIKVIDFGTSQFTNGRASLKGRFGTLFYVAPEVLNNNYNFKCDIWSAGVILYILLSGQTPFNGRNNKEVLEKIRCGRFGFHGQQWKNISDLAKDFIAKLMAFDPQERPSADEALQDPWILQFQQANLFDDVQIDKVLDNLLQFNSMKKLQQAIMAYIANQIISQNETLKLTDAFQKLDTNGDGLISREELTHAFEHLYGYQGTLEKVDKIMQFVDTDHSGFIDYSEFITASLQQRRVLSRNNIDTCFTIFDKDGNGTISIDELRDLIGQSITVDNQVWQEIVADFDANGDGEIDLMEFKDMMLRKLSN